jgi:tripartite-type tricarboxylate transporter receptor subunit TctC
MSKAKRLKELLDVKPYLMAAALITFAADYPAQAASAQAAYPSRPVRLIVGFAPGGSDVPARMLAQKLAEKLGQPFVVDNRPGAASVLATDILAKAPADGYTLMFSTASHAVTAVYYLKLPYDPIRDFAPVASVGSVPFLLVTHPSLPATTVKEFVAIAKAKAGQFNYGSPGTGSIGHLAQVLFAKQAGFEATHIAYKGTGPAVTAVLAGEIQFYMPNLIGAMPQVRTGKLRALGVAEAQRSPLAPDIPTIAEGGVRGVEAGTWYGVMAPRGTPQPIVDRLNQEIVGTLRTPAFRDQLATIGVVPDIGTPQQFAAFIRSEIDKWDGVMKFSGMKKEAY